MANIFATNVELNDSNDTEIASAVQSIPVIDVNQLFREHHHHLLRFVQRYVRSSEDVEDVVQNTFMEAVRCADRFSGLSKPSTWLFGIALNLARNHVRRKCNDVLEPIEEAVLEQIADQDADPANVIELRQLAGRVQTILNTLPLKIRSTFEAVLDGEFTYEQAAEKMHVPIGTVRSRVSRVRATVRSAFE